MKAVHCPCGEVIEAETDDERQGRSRLLTFEFDSDVLGHVLLGRASCSRLMQLRRDRPWTSLSHRQKLGKSSACR